MRQRGRDPARAREPESSWCAAIPQRGARLLAKSAALVAFTLPLLCRAPFAFAADEETRRVVLVEQGRDPFLERVGAEIAGLGFALVRSANTRSLEGAARSEQAVAAIRVLPSRKGVEVWMSDATSGRSLLRQVIVDESEGGPDERLIALQAAELLRTSLQTQVTTEATPAASKPAEPARPAAAPSPAEPSQPVAPRPLNGAAQAALGALYSPGGASFALELGLSLHHSLTRRWGLLLDVGVPLRGASVSQGEASARVAPYFVGVGALATLTSPGSRSFGTLGVGAAVLHLAVRGEADSPLLASSESVSTGAAYVRGDFGVEVTPWLRAGGRALLGARVQQVHVRFAGKEAAAWGPLFAGGFALLEVAWR